MTSHFGKRLHLAAWSGQAEVVRYLCKQNADVGATAMDDMGAIHFAAQKGHLDIVRTLLSSGASIKASTRKGFTALHYAVQGSHLELVKYLIKKGANLSSKTKAGKTPLDLASNEEIRSCLEEFENASKKCDLNGKQKAEESDPKQSVPGEGKSNSKQYAMKEVESDHDAIKALHDEPESGSSKRKDDEDNVKEASPAPKKAKVPLNHLLSADDTEDNEENL